MGELVPELSAEYRLMQERIADDRSARIETAVRKKEVSRGRWRPPARARYRVSTAGVTEPLPGRGPTPRPVPRWEGEFELHNSCTALTPREHFAPNRSFRMSSKSGQGGEQGGSGGQGGQKGGQGGQDDKNKQDGQQGGKQGEQNDKNKQGGQQGGGQGGKGGSQGGR